MRAFFPLACFLSSISSLVAIQTNTTISIDDWTALPSYAESGTWEDGTDLAGASYRIGSGNLATVTFSFTGIAVHLVSPLINKRSSLVVSLDGAPPAFVRSSNSCSPSSTRGDIIWSQTGLTQGDHTLVLLKSSEPAPILIGGLILTSDAPDSNGLAQTLLKPRNPPPGPPPKKKGISLFEGSLPKTVGLVVGLVVGIIVLTGVLVWWLFTRRNDARRTGPVAFSQWAVNLPKPTARDVETSDFSTTGDNYRVMSSTGPVFVLDSARQSRVSVGFGSRPSLERDPTLPRRSWQQRRGSAGSAVVNSQLDEERRTQPAVMSSQLEKAQMLRRFSTRTIDHGIIFNPPPPLPGTSAPTGISPPPAYTLP